MLLRTLAIIAFAAMITQYVHPAQLIKVPQETTKWISATDRYSNEQSVGSDWLQDYYSGPKGVLERRIRLRSRLNTHLLGLKFRM